MRIVLRLAVVASCSFFVGCSSGTDTQSNERDGVAQCAQGKQVPIDFFVSNLPSSVSIDHVVVWVQNDQGQWQQLRRGPTAGSFVGSGIVGNHYRAAILDGGTLHQRDVDIGYQAYQGCDFNASYDWVTGEAPTGV